MFRYIGVVIMGKTKLAIDLDDTIADTMSEWVNVANIELGRKISKGQMKKYDIDDILGLSKSYVKSIFAKVWESPDKVKLIDSYIPEAMDEISKNYEAYIVTGASSSKETIQEWLDNKGIKYSKLIMVEHAIEKAEIGKELGIRIFIDDSPKVGKHVVEEGMDLIMIRQPWNEDFIKQNDSKNVFPTSDWRGVMDLLEKIEG